MQASFNGGRAAASLLAAGAVALVAPPAGAAGVIALPQTGQTTSYATGDDGDLQEGVAWPTPRFVANGDGTLTDQLTGLVWLGDANCAGTIAYDPDATGDGTMSWPNANFFVSQVSSGALDISACGYDGSDDDWRVANVIELESVVNVSFVDQSTWLGGEGFTNVQPGPYWSSTTTEGNDARAYALEASNGKWFNNFKSSRRYFVWPVRGGAEGVPDPGFPANLWRLSEAAVGPGVTWPVPRLVDNGDGTVTDALTGLMWLKDLGCLGTGSWQTALDTIADFNVAAPGTYTCTDYVDGSYPDWRMPNRRETFSLLDFSTSRPAFPVGHPFVEIAPFRGFHGSTTDQANINRFWFVETWIFGELDQQGKRGDTYGIWPVRSVADAKVPSLAGPLRLGLAALLLAAAVLWLRRP